LGRRRRENSPRLDREGPRFLYCRGIGRKKLSRGALKTTKRYPPEGPKLKGAELEKRHWTSKKDNKRGAIQGRGL